MSAVTIHRLTELAAGLLACEVLYKVKLRPRVLRAIGVEVPS